MKCSWLPSSTHKLLLCIKISGACSWVLGSLFSFIVRQFLISVSEHCSRKNIWTISFPRDSLLASLLDGVRASGNRDVCVKMTPTDKGQRWGLLSVPVDEEVESLHLRFLATPPSKSSLFRSVFFLNLNKAKKYVLWDYPTCSIWHVLAMLVSLQMATSQMLCLDSTQTFHTVEFCMQLRKM